MDFPYKSFCWCLGTTSFRTERFNQKIEEQLFLLDEFWSDPDNEKEKWNGNSRIQSRYYNFMQKKGFVKGDADNKEKDAREKTSGLVDIGLIDNNRRLSAAGKSLLGVSKSGNFNSDNFLLIDRDSFIYLKQMLKTGNRINENYVRPFIVLLFLLCRFDYLTLDEFTYLLPLCTGEEETNEIEKAIRNLRLDFISIDEIIIARLLNMNNYQKALSYFLENEVTEGLICDIGLNRKSRKYDKAYYPLYKALYNTFINKNPQEILSIYKTTKQIKIGLLWRQFLFDTNSEKAVEKDPLIHLKNTDFSDIKNENDLKIVFFKTMHLLKAKATLRDYLDLNRRYIKTTDVVLFEDSTVKLDVVPFYFFKSSIQRLENDMFTESKVLYDDCRLENISPSLTINERLLIDNINKGLGIHISSIKEARKTLNDKRYERLEHLIDKRFTDNNLISLLDHFENRNDKAIWNMVTDNADIPTIFEYILGIIWYKISGRSGNILDYMKLSLDADLLPKTHAGGGEADIIYEYSKTDSYPEHMLLIEATLSEATNQRRMEMEPVSRHLGQHLLKTGNNNSYCVFITNYLDINVVTDFRIRKTAPFYDRNDYTKVVNGMKIIPLQTSELKKIITQKKTYRDLFTIFDDAYRSNLPPHEWYKACIVVKIQ